MTSEVTQAALEPCPFCGGMASEETSKGPTGERYRWVQCEKCGAMSECCDDSARANNPDEPEPVLLWNTRLTAQSGEGRSGAGEDALEIRALKAAKQFIENGIEMGFIRMPDASTPDSAHETLSLIRTALNARQSGEGERLRGVLVEHFPTGVRGLYEHSAQRIPVQTYVGTNCLCGWCTSATDEHEVREEWAAHVLAAIRATDDAGGA